MIVAPSDVVILAPKQETQTIPIVMVASADPVGTGFIASRARPGGNITGLSQMSPELSGKRLELLKEVVPGFSLVVFLWNPDVRGAGLFASQRAIDPSKPCRYSSAKRKRSFQVLIRSADRNERFNR